MNTLSWMLYLVGIIPNLAGFTGFLTVITGFGVCGFLVAYFLARCEAEDRRNGESLQDRYREWSRTHLRFFSVCITLFLICGVITTIVPSSDTLHLILASELGETVVQNDEVQEIFGLLKDRLKDELVGGGG